MIFFRTAVLVTGLSLMFTLVDIPLPHAQVEFAAANGVVGVTEIPVSPHIITSPAETTVKVKKKGVKKGVKKRKKRHNKSAAKKSVEVISEKTPSGVLTISQVMELIKTTRDLSGKNLSGLQLVGINLSKCNLKGIDLRDANLERADLGESQLDRADFSGANLKMANLRVSGITAANLERAILDGAIWVDGTVCQPGSIGQCQKLIIPSYVK